MKLKVDSKNFLARGSHPLREANTEVEKFYSSDGDAEKRLETIRLDLVKLQERLYADSRHSVLLILQGMDTSGKDGIIRHVFSGINPQGVQVTSFKRPSDEELEHDYLWRAVARLPRRGAIGVFNRSYYEEVIVVRVNPEILESQRLPHIGKNIWNERFQQIRDFETYLSENGWKIVKCFLHLSKKEQAKRLLKRLEDEKKNWKFEAGDMTARNDWKKYQSAYDECLAKTSTKVNPWHIVPADDKANARIVVATILREALEALPLRYPSLSREENAELSKFLKVLKP